jgi:hypothetical protein
LTHLDPYVGAVGVDGWAADEAVICHLEDGGFGLLVDGHDAVSSYGPDA